MPELLKWPRFEQFILRGGIIANASGVDSPKRSEAVGLGTGIQYVHHRTPGSYRGVRDQKPVTTPGYSLGAHYHRRLEPRESQHIFERVFELPRLHVIGVGAETGVSPLGVVGIAPASPPAAERGQVSVSQTRIDQ
jgi:hypothetical protein